MGKVVATILDRLKLTRQDGLTLINPREEDGHGSTPGDPSHVSHADADIMVPADIQSVYREDHFSTSTPLGASASVSSTPTAIGTFSRLAGTAYANVAGEVKVWLSGDGGVNYDADPYSFNVIAGQAKRFSVHLEGATHAYVEYVNDTTPQTDFRLFAQMVVL